MGWFNLRAIFWHQLLRLAVWISALAVVVAMVHLGFECGKAQGSLDCWRYDGGRP